MFYPSKAAVAMDNVTIFIDDTIPMGNLSTCCGHNHALIDDIGVAFAFTAFIPYMFQCGTIVAKGSWGISSRLVFFQSLFATTALALRIIMEMFSVTVACMVNKYITDLSIRDSILGVVQAFSQWLGATVLLVVYVSQREDYTEFINYPLSFLSSEKILCRCLAYSFVMVLCSVAMVYFSLQAPYRAPLKGETAKEEYVFFSITAGFAVTVLSLCSAYYNFQAFHFQIKRMIKSKSARNISTTWLFLQAAQLVFVGSNQWQRFLDVAWCPYNADGSEPRL